MINCTKIPFWIKVLHLLPLVQVVVRKYLPLLVLFSRRPAVFALSILRIAVEKFFNKYNLNFSAL